MHVVRSALVTTVVAAVTVLTTTAAPGAAADPREPFVTCHQSNEGGTDTDTCVGNPNATGGSTDEPHVRVGFCFGIGPISGDNCGD